VSLGEKQWKIVAYFTHFHVNLLQLSSEVFIQLYGNTVGSLNQQPGTVTHTPVIPATWEVEIGRIQSQLG
jgi:hypothetical protein